MASGTCRIRNFSMHVAWSRYIRYPVWLTFGGYDNHESNNMDIVNTTNSGNCESVLRLVVFYFISRNNLPDRPYTWYMHRPMLLSSSFNRLDRGLWTIPFIYSFSLCVFYIIIIHLKSIFSLKIREKKKMGWSRVTPASCIKVRLSGNPGPPGLSFYDDNLLRTDAGTTVKQLATWSFPSLNNSVFLNIWTRRKTFFNVGAE